MKKHQTKTLSRFLLYFGLTIQITYIIMTPFMEISFFVLASTVLLMTAAFMSLSVAKAELSEMQTSHELTWEAKRKKLQDYYTDEKNLNNSFSESLKNIQMDLTHNERISKILESYQTSNKKFKIKLNRKPENRVEKYLY